MKFAEEKLVLKIQKKFKKTIPFFNILSYGFYGIYAIPGANIILYLLGVNLIKLNIFLVYIESVIFIIKNTVGRRRPYIKHKDVKGYDTKKPKSKSFPSSHAAYALLLILIIRKLWRPSKLLYLFPVLMGLSRIILGVHYPSDVLVGYFIGWLFYLQAKSYIIV